jgi:hypothetical protein
MKLDPIRAKDRALCDRAVMEKWLYGVEQRSVQRATNTSSPINHCEDQTTTAEEELDRENNCKDQSEGSECVKQQKRRGKRKRAPRTMQ